jgi:hypothetical protein
MIAPSFPNEEEIYQGQSSSPLLPPPPRQQQQQQQQQRPRILNAWSPNGSDALSTPLPHVLPAVSSNQSLAAIEVLRAENYEYKTGTDEEGRFITNRPELEEHYDPDEWMPATKYDSSRLQITKLNPDLNDWEKKLWMMQKDKPLRPGRQIMVRKPKELIVPKSIGLPQRPLETKLSPPEPVLPIFERLNALYGKFEEIVTKPRQVQMIYPHPWSLMTLMQRMRMFIQEDQPESMPAFIQWQEIQGRIGIILLAAEAFELQSESHPGRKQQIAMTKKIKASWDKITPNDQAFLECKEIENTKPHVIQQQQPVIVDDGKFYADCTRIDAKAIKGPDMIFDLDEEGNIKLLTAEEFYLKECQETEEEWYRRFMKQNPKATPLAAKKHLLDLRCRYIPYEKTLVFKVPGLEKCEQKKKDAQTTEVPFQDAATVSAPPSPRNEESQQE